VGATEGVTSKLFTALVGWASETPGVSVNTIAASASIDGSGTVEQPTLIVMTIRLRTIIPNLLNLFMKSSPFRMRFFQTILLRALGVLCG
jgi:hypothetical protein